MLFYFNNIHPEENAFEHALIERIIHAYSFYKTQKCFSKRERKILKEVLLEDLYFIFQIIDSNEISEELKEIFKALSGIDYEKMIAEELTKVKNKMEAMLKEEGVDIDLSDIDINNPDEEILKNIFDSLDNNHQEQPKTKKQIEHELTQNASKELQDKSINGIYKRLAKIFHPDLERNETQKAQKESLMKTLTIAYKNRDLYTLLALEIEWINSSNKEAHLQNNDQLKLYNSVLKKQVKTMEYDIEALVLSARYAPIRGFYNGSFCGIFVLENFHKELKQDVEKLKQLNKRLQTSEAITLLKEIIIEYSQSI